MDSYETVKLLLDKGVHTFYLMPHTCCAGDSKMNFESIEADLSFQERKIMDAVSKVRQYAKSLNVPLTIKPYILNLTATNVEHIAFADDGKENIGIHYTAPFPQEQAAGV
ncbi:MAG TPA: hypothetical protein VHQ20_02280 [Patescibacteria group bacterium]|nr:hypothetical protein [Patescibacteria group bacterium]